MKHFAQKVLFAVLLALTIVGLFCVPVSAEESIHGTFGSEIEWEITDNILYISGSGEMPTHSYPWDDYKTEITGVVVEEGITGLTLYTFRDFIHLQTIQLPSSLTDLGYASFSGCSELVSVEIPSLVTDIPEMTFDSCYSLEKVILPDSLKTINFAAFDDCRALKEIFVPDSVQSISYYVFRDCVKLEVVNIPSGITQLKSGMFSGCKSLVSIKIPQNVKSMDGIFRNCSSLKNVEFEEGIITIGDSTFSGCSALTSISLPNTVEVLGSDVFYYCDNLSSITLSNNLEEIGAGAFYLCPALTQIEIPISVVRIKQFAFNDALKSVYYLGTKEQWDEIDISDNNDALNNASITFAICNHQWSNEYTIDKAATCTEKGSKSFHCLLCDTIQEESIQPIDILEHQYDEGTITEDVTCTGEGIKTYTCENCGNTYTVTIPASGHSYEKDGYCTSCNEFIFTDITGDKSKGYISWAYENGIVKGTGENSFSPEDGCTRVQFVMMLWKMNGEPTVTGVKNPFTDVAGVKTIKAIKWALSKNIINSGTTFNPNDSVSRVNIVMMLWKMAGNPKVSGTNPFKDVSGSKTINAVLWAYKKGITKGTSDTTFSPNINCTRLQLVTFLYKYNRKYKLV